MEFHHVTGILLLPIPPSLFEELQAVDVQVLVREKNGGIDESVLAQVKARVTAKPGPAGWNEAVLEFLQANLAKLLKG